MGGWIGVATDPAEGWPLRSGEATGHGVGAADGAAHGGGGRRHEIAPSRPVGEGIGISDVMGIHRRWR